MSDLALTAARLFAAGFTDLVSVIPPTGTLAPTSRISVEQRGKVPGRKNRFGTWAGYDWRKEPSDAEAAATMDRDAANVGIRGDRFPAVDVDCTDAALSALIVGMTRDLLGAAPTRTGRAPKALLLYRTDAPFGRLRLWIKDRTTQVTHLVEVLGAGQQFVAAGIHPATLKAYAWDQDICERGAASLTPITREKADAFLGTLMEALSMMGYDCWREGTGGDAARANVAQDALLAPSLDALAEAVRLIPNDDPEKIGRDAYIKLGYAIRAASGDDDGDAFGIFLEWALRWPGNERAAATDAETVRDDWRRMKGPYAVGWPYIVELARPHGFSDAELEFEPVPDDEPAGPDAVLFSDHDLAVKVMTKHGDRIRAVPVWGAFLVWDGSRWLRDTKNRVDSLISEVLVVEADRAARMGATPNEQRQWMGVAKGILNGNTVGRVRRLIAASPALALDPSQLDTDPWLLNTPGGAVNLRNGALLTHNADRLCSKSAAVTPGTASCPRWLRFLDEACDGPDMVDFLRRFAGYCLTGNTSEHSLCFVHGPGGNGKSVFLDTLAYVLGDYATQAPMETFTAARFDRHPTELAALNGARLVTASETDAGRRWNEARLKQLTGGDAVTARLMRSDFFTFKPTFKLLIVGNHKPVLRAADEAMRRRLHLVPFVKRPEHPDKELVEKLRAEAPGILRWMIEGCLEWQQVGLNPPESVLLATDEYFDDEDAMGRWISEECVVDETERVLTLDAYGSWRDWCARMGEHPGSAKSFAARVEAHGFKKWKHPDTRRRGFKGFAPRAQMDFPVEKTA